MSGHKSEKKGPNIICRVSNVTPEMVCRYVERLPKQKMTEDAFRNYMGKKWFQNEHQAPEQWGLYYIDGTNYYPRFNHDITTEEANAYLYHWMNNLIVINPYTRFKKQCDKKLVESIVYQLEKNPNDHDLKTIICRIIDSDEPFVINEIIANALNNYSRALKVEIINKDEERYNVSLLPNYKELLKTKNDMTKKEYFELFDGVKTAFDLSAPLQQIFYGAPGTGKSNIIKKLVDEQNKRCHRITFHPDSDYSTFVGAYKPTMKVSSITKDGVTTKEEKIVYKFCPQAFTNAYVEAWNTEEEVYLIIEEINRGNCAQIFGDLFQLLDRKNGVSEYPVDADADLAAYIRKELEDSPRQDIPQCIKEGKKLMLPSNLYIWATMNTSDQSLFPIDSAFKRRWEWKYMKIKKGKDELGNELNWKIAIKDNDGNLVKINGEDSLPWWNFIEKINEIIASMTSSADKQLGYFFCKAGNDGEIPADKFVSKVIFYLWNDVFKDYGFEDAYLFQYTVKDSDGKDTEKDLTFPDFYEEDGENINTERLADFLTKVMNWKKTAEDNN